MAVTATVTEFRKMPDGRIYVRFDDGDMPEFASIADLTAWARALDMEPENAKRLAVAWAVTRSADLSNVSTILNKTLTFDLSQNNAIVVR